MRRRLDAQGVRIHLLALAQAASQLEIRTKDAETQYSNASQESLLRLAERLCEGALLAVQLRFELEGHLLCDTLTRVGQDAYRLVRMPQDDV